MLGLILATLWFFSKSQRSNDTTIVKAFDKGKWHLDSVAEHGLPEAHAFHHTVYYMYWLIENKMTNDFFRRGTRLGISFLELSWGLIPVRNNSRSGPGTFQLFPLSIKSCDLTLLFRDLNRKLLYFFALA